jgi:hypothetical protein
VKEGLYGKKGRIRRSMKKDRISSLRVRHNFLGRGVLGLPSLFRFLHLRFNL